MTSSGGVVCCLFHDLDGGVYAHPIGCDFFNAIVSDGVIEIVGICLLTMNDVYSCVHYVSAIATDPIKETEI